MPLAVPVAIVAPPRMTLTVLLASAVPDNVWAGAFVILSVLEVPVSLLMPLMTGFAGTTLSIFTTMLPESPTLPALSTA